MRTRSLLLTGCALILASCTGTAASSYIPAIVHPGGAVLWEPPRPEPAPEPAAEPVRLRIPRIGVDAAVERAGLTPDGAMDVPKDPRNTAWYAHGHRPGDPGKAVIVGHLDTPTGPAVFWGLDALAAGDEITVTDAEGQSRVFAVRGMRLLDADETDMEEVFGGAGEPVLHLITCRGEWTGQEYSQRLLVIAREVRA